MDFPTETTAAAAAPATTDAPVSAPDTTAPPSYDAHSLVDSYFSQPEPQSDAPLFAEQPEVTATTPDDAPEDAPDDPVDGPVVDYQAKYSEYTTLAEQLGLNEALIPTSLQLVGGIVALDDQNQPTTNPFWEQMEQQSERHLTQLVNDAVSRYGDYVLSRFDQAQLLQAVGLNPQLADIYAQVQPDGTLNGQTVGGYDPEVLNSIPQELRDTYKALPLEDQLELDGMTPERRNFKLQQQHKLDSFEKAQKDAESRAAQEREQRLEQERDARLQTFIKSEEERFYNDLAKSFTPFGNDPAKAAQTERLHRAIYADVTASLSKDPNAPGLLEGLGKAVREGDQFTQTQLLNRINILIAKYRNQSIADWNSVIGAPIQAAQQQRQQIAKTVAVNGTGGFSADRQQSGLPNPGDPNDPANLIYLAEQHGFRFPG